MVMKPHWSGCLLNIQPFMSSVLLLEKCVLNDKIKMKINSLMIPALLLAMMIQQGKHKESWYISWYSAKLAWLRPGLLGMWNLSHILRVSWMVQEKGILHSWVKFRNEEIMVSVHQLLFLLLFWPWHKPHGILVPRPGIEPTPPALGAWSLNHWTATGSPSLCFCYRLKWHVEDRCSVQFSCSVVSNSVTPWITARQASLSITNSWSLLKLMFIELVMPSNHLIL